MYGRSVFGRTGRKRLVGFVFRFAGRNRLCVSIRPADAKECPAIAPRLAGLCVSIRPADAKECLAIAPHPADAKSVLQLRPDG